MQGILLVDKPKDWTSFDVVNYVRRIVAKHEGKKPKNCKVGHTGTLDPFATGLLLILVGKEYTRKAQGLSKVDKTYEVTAVLGATSTTGDPEGEITPFVAPSAPAVISTEVEKSLLNQGLSAPLEMTEMEAYGSSQDDGVGSAQHDLNDEAVVGTALTQAAILKALEGFKGQIEQVPPAFSAIKVNGQRAYKLAREGKEVKIEPRKVTINSLELIDYDYPHLKLCTSVSSGTYIRTLVEDIGKKLGTGAYTAELRRTSVGEFLIKDAIHPKDIDQEVLQKHLTEIG